MKKTTIKNYGPKIKKSICVVSVESGLNPIKNILNQKQELKQYCLANNLICEHCFCVATLKDKDTIEEIIKYVQNCSEPLHVIFLKDTNVPAIIAKRLEAIIDGYIHFVRNQSILTLRSLRTAIETGNVNLVKKALKEAIIYDNLSDEQLLSLAVSMMDAYEPTNKNLKKSKK